MESYFSLNRNGKPIRNLNHKPPWRIALIGNLKSEYEPAESDPPDAGSEFDCWKTVKSIAKALEEDEHWVHFLHADYTLPEAITNLRPQICFNIAEGLQGNGREAHVPALCELMGIPYTASRVVPNALSLDKAITKKIWRDAGLPTANFLEATRLADLEQIQFDFPMFVKPAREGSGMGISSKSLVHNRAELSSTVSSMIRTYHQPVLVEEFLPGREFTVGFIGNPGSPENRNRSYLYNQEGYHWFPIMEIDSRTSVSPAIYGQEAKSRAIGTTGAPAYLCPAELTSSFHEQLISLTRQAAEILDVSDVSRIDIRLGADQKPYLLEINTLPGLNPDLSDLCIMAASEGLDYPILITEILYLAAERYQMPLPANQDLREAKTLQRSVFSFEMQPAVPIASSGR